MPVYCQRRNRIAFPFLKWITGRSLVAARAETRRFYRFDVPAHPSIINVSSYD
jgi:hypothetical protein